MLDRDGHVEIINSSDVATENVISALAEEHPEVATMMRWGQQIHKSRRGGLFERDKFLTPESVYDQMRVAQDAVQDDDVVSGVCETSEALALSRMSIQCEDEDEEDIWNQIADDCELDIRIREMWQEMFIVSQFYVSVWWGVKDFKVRGKTKEGVTRKRQFRRMRVPTSITLLDPLRIVPVGNFLYNQEQLAWIATRNESTLYQNVLAGEEEDEIIKRLFTGRYTAVDRGEQQRLGMLGVDHRNLWLLDPKNVFRVTATRPQYRPFATVRMKSVFELLDLKHLLREMDRAHLLGATNFIVLIKKGSDQMPAKNTELSALQASVRTLSRVPVIVGDHRLSIEIVTPDTDMLLQPEKYNTIDARITARLYQMFMTGNFAAGAKGDDSMKLVRIVARSLEARRSHIKKAVERKLLTEIYERNDLFTTKAALTFHPKSISIDFDPGLAAVFLDLLDRRHISRGTVLEQIDLDEDDEARKREREIDAFDDIFDSLTPIQDPQQVQDHALETLNKDQQNSLETLDKQQQFQDEQGDKQRKFAAAHPPAGPGGAKPAAKATPAKKPTPKADPKSAGRSGGGNRSGGGSAPGSGQGQAKDPRRRARG